MSADRLSPTIGLDELASLLGRAPATVAKRWRRLHRDHGFPRPLPGLGLLWSRGLVEAWIAAGGRIEVTCDDGTATAPNVIHLQREALAQRYGGAR